MSIKVDEKIDAVLAPVKQRYEEFEIKTDTRLLDLQKQISDLGALMLPKPPPSMTQNFPPLPSRATLSDPLSHAQLSKHPTITNHSHSHVTNSEDTSETSTVRRIVAQAKRVVGISPVTPSNLETQNTIPGEDPLLKAVIEYLRKELNVRESEISEHDIEEVFIPFNFTRANFSRVYVKFKSEESANLCLNLAKSIKDVETRITRYFPRQFNARARALGSIAYKMRNSEPSYKTSIQYTDDDLTLLICPRGQYTYSPYLVDNLPPIDLTPLRSPPVGRKKKRPRSGTQSPQADANKKDRKDSCSSIGAKEVLAIPADTGNNATEGRDVECVGLGAIDGEQANDSPTTPTPAPAIDVGLFQNLQASSPTTGKLFLQFSDSNPRRHSLNC